MLTILVDIAGNGPIFVFVDNFRHDVRVFASPNKDDHFHLHTFKRILNLSVRQFKTVNIAPALVWSGFLCDDSLKK